MSSSTSAITDFSRDILGRYVCNGTDEALNSATGPNPAPFDVIVIGGGTFGGVVAQHLFSKDATHSHRILVLDGGPFAISEHVQNLPMLGLNPPGATSIQDLRNAGQYGLDKPRAEVWGLPWHANATFPGLAYCVGGRSVFWGGWSPQLLHAEMVGWPAAVVADLEGRYFQEAAKQIGVSEANDFISGPIHLALRQQLFDAIQAGEITEAVPFAELPLQQDVQSAAFTLGAGAGTAAGPQTAGMSLGAGAGAAAAMQPAGSAGAGALDILKLEAPLAVQSQTDPGFFPINKFSSAPLLMESARAAESEAQQATSSGLPADVDKNKRLMIVPYCQVMRLLRSNGRVTGVRVKTKLDTVSRDISVPPNGAVVIALGTIESTRLALLSFQGAPNLGEMGRNLLAHLRSNLTIRIPLSSLRNLDRNAHAAMAQLLQGPQTSALILKGRHVIRQPNKPDLPRTFHLQITAAGGDSLATDAEANLFKKIPDIDTFGAFRAVSENDVVITIRGIGEREPLEPRNFVTLDPEKDEFGEQRAFVSLHDPREPGGNQRERELWDAMDKAADEVARAFAGGQPYEVLSPPQGEPTEIRRVRAGGLPSEVQPFNERRDGVGTTFHEAGTLRMGDDAQHSVTDADCRFHFSDNTYVAAPSLFPTIGSPNPMLTGVALARRLGDHLLSALPHAVAPSPAAGFRYLFDGTEGSFRNWRKAGQDAFALIDGRIVTSGTGDFAVLFYAVENFGDFVLRLQFQLNTVDGSGRLTDNSGIFVRFRNPLLPPDADTLRRDGRFHDINRSRAWVAVHSGFEVQIDEQALGDTRIGEQNGLDKNRTGAIYKIPSGQNGEPRMQSFQRGPALQAGQWNDYEIQVSGDTYTVRLNGQQTTTFTNAGAPNANPDIDLKNRGLSSARDNASGYIGLQSYFGSRVAFRNIQIRQS